MNSLLLQQHIQQPLGCSMNNLNGITRISVLQFLTFLRFLAGRDFRRET